MGRIKTFLRNLNYLSKHSLWEQREEDIVYLTNKILDDGIYEYGIEYEDLKKPHILNKEESFDLIIDSGKSFIRTADGEINIIRGIDQPFQKYEKEIADSLIETLRNKKNNILVGINADYYCRLGTEGKNIYNRRHAYEYRQIYSEYINLDSTYINMNVTGYELGNEHNKDTEKAYKKWREAFRNKNIVIVCGKGILDKLEFDVFEYASSKEFVYGPPRNAWDVHEDLLNEIRTRIDKDKLLVFILGMAGKAMIPILADEGYICWDVGHLAKYYDVFKGQKIKKPEDIDSFFAPD